MKLALTELERHIVDRRKLFANKPAIYMKRSLLVYCRYAKRLGIT